MGKNPIAYVVSRATLEQELCLDPKKVDSIASNPNNKQVERTISYKGRNIAVELFVIYSSRDPRNRNVLELLGENNFPPRKYINAVTEAETDEVVFPYDDREIPYTKSTAVALEIYSSGSGATKSTDWKDYLSGKAIKILTGSGLTMQEVATLLEALPSEYTEEEIRDLERKLQDMEKRELQRFEIESKRSKITPNKPKDTESEEDRTKWELIKKETYYDFVISDRKNGVRTDSTSPDI